MKIAYVTTYDALNIKNWSGISYYMAKSLERQSASLEYIGPLNQLVSDVVDAKKYVYSQVLHKGYLTDREPMLLKDYARQVSENLERLDVDIVFSPGSVPIAYLECHQPIAFWTDATFAGMVDFYPAFSNLCQETIDNGNKMEKAALDRARVAIYSSEWAARTAIQHYQIDESKVKVVPFGANIESHRTIQDITRIVDARPFDRCKLLFLGVDWHRKGGDIALQIARELNRSGLPTELTIAGCQPPSDAPLPPFVRSMGLLSKATSEGQSAIEELLAESHFLIMPSRAECYGIVLCEACSFGVPCLSTNVGGIPTIIKDGVNGRTFSTDAQIEEYCAAISNLFSNYEEYRSMAVSAFREYESRLNWNVAAQQVLRLLSGSESS